MSRGVQVVTEVESLKARRNEGSKEVGRTKDAERRAQLIEEMRLLGDEIAAKDEQVRAMDEELYNLLSARAESAVARRAGRSG